MLGELAPHLVHEIDLHNPRRVMRAIEIALGGGSRADAPVLAPHAGSALLLGLRLERRVLFEIIGRRVDSQIAAGLVDEVATLYAIGCGPDLASMQGFGYREIGAYLRGECSREDAIAGYKLATRRYARRQITWFKRDRRICWLPAIPLPVEAAVVGDTPARYSRDARGLHLLDQRVQVGGGEHRVAAADEVEVAVEGACVVDRPGAHDRSGWSAL